MRILIIKPTALGDVATTLPLLCDLKRAHPAAHIDWLIHPAYTALVQGHNALHSVIPFDRKRLAAWWYKPAAFKSFRHLLHTLRANHYDTVIDAQGLFRSGFLTRITGAKTRIGFANAREGATLAYTHPVELPEAGANQVAVERMRALGAAIGTNPSTPAVFDMPLQPPALAKAQSLAPNNFTALIPGARWDTKRWPADRYAQLADHLLENHHNIVLLGSPDEAPLCAALQSKIKNQKSKIPVTNLAGKTDLATMIALLAKASLVIGNDSGPLHVAVALGRPVIALYGPTSPAYVGPYGQLSQVLREDVPCHPCRRKTCDHHSCMNRLTVDRAWEKTALTIQGITHAH